MANVVRIFEQQFETLKKMPKKDQPKMALAMLEFAFTGAISVDLNYIQDLALTPMKPSLKITQTGGCPKGVVRNPAGLNQYSEVKGYPNPNPNGNPKGLVKSFINNNSLSLSSSSSVSTSGNSLGKEASNLSTTRGKKTYGEMQKVKLTDDEYEKLKAIYNDKLDFAIDKLDSYLAQKRKDPYNSHYAVMKRNGWVYNEAFPDDDIPSGPKILDPKNFVRAKPFGEEFNA